MIVGLQEVSELIVLFVIREAVGLILTEYRIESSKEFPTNTQSFEGLRFA